MDTHTNITVERKKFLVENKEYSDVQMEHLYAKWLYTYGGASDYKTYESYVDEYDDDIDEYGNCPCYICQR